MPRRAHWIKYERAENYSPLFIRVEPLRLWLSTRLRFEKNDAIFAQRVKESAERDLSFCLGPPVRNKYSRRSSQTEIARKRGHIQWTGWIRDDANRKQICARDWQAMETTFVQTLIFVWGWRCHATPTPMSHPHWVGTQIARAKYFSHSNIWERFCTFEMWVEFD